MVLSWRRSAFSRDPRLTRATCDLQRATCNLPSRLCYEAIYGRIQLMISAIGSVALRSVP